MDKQRNYLGILKDREKELRSKPRRFFETVELMFRDMKDYFSMLEDRAKELRTYSNLIDGRLKTKEGSYLDVLESKRLQDDLRNFKKSIESVLNANGDIGEEIGRFLHTQLLKAYEHMKKTKRT